LWRQIINSLTTPVQKNVTLFIACNFATSAFACNSKKEIRKYVAEKKKKMGKNSFRNEKQYSL
jgi:hypothetical protein